MSPNEKETTDLPVPKGFSKDNLTVSHIEVALQKDLTVAHLAQALNGGTQNQTAETQQTQNQPASSQIQQPEVKATDRKKG